MQHIVFGLFCFAGIVLATPNWFLTHAKPMSNSLLPNEAKKGNDTLPEAEPADQAPSILEGTARFACW